MKARFIEDDVLARSNLKYKMKCTDNACEEEATEIRYRGKEKIPYCKNHAAWWDELMKHLD